MSSPEPLIGTGKERITTEQVRARWEDFALNTSMHGIGPAHLHKHLARKLLYSLAFLLGLAAFSYNFYLIIVRYTSYPTSTSINMVLNNEVAFPAVTICNVNPIRRRAIIREYEEGNEHIRNMLTAIINELGMEIEDLIDIEESDDAPPSPGPPLPPKDPSPPIGFGKPVKQFKMPIDDDDHYKRPKGRSGCDREMDLTQELMENAIAALNTLPPWLRRALGHQIDDMLLGCTANAYACNPSDFRWFYNYQGIINAVRTNRYGNCYTFNAQLENDTRTFDEWDNDPFTGRMKIYRSGPLYGLQLKLFIEQDDYFKVTSNYAGLKVAIHDPKVMPFPEDFGYLVPPGHATSFGMKQVLLFREDHPHGECGNLTDKAIRERNVYIDYIKHTNYSTTACIKTCLQQHLVGKCACAEPSIPYSADYSALASFWPYGSDRPIQPCNSSDADESLC